MRKIEYLHLIVTRILFRFGQTLFEGDDLHMAVSKATQSNKHFNVPHDFKHGVGDPLGAHHTNSTSKG